MTSMVRAGGLRWVPELVKSLGGDEAALLRRYRISPQALADDDALIAVRSVMYLYEAAAEELGCPDFGLRLAERQDLSVFGLTAVAIQNSATMAEAAQRASRYLFVHSPAIRFTLLPKSEIDPKLAEIRFEVEMTNPPPMRQFMDLSLGQIHRGIQWLTQGQFSPEVVCLPHTPTATLATYKRFFGTKIRAAQGHAALLFPPKLLDARPKAANDMMGRMAAELLDTRFSAPDQTMTSRVRKAISDRLGTAGTGQVEIAQLFSMHPRALQRHLNNEGTTFEEIRDGLRRDAARRYLIETEMPLQQVAALLELAEQSALTRVCKRWFNKTPSAIRLARSKRTGQ